MKRITATIKPFALDPVQAAIEELGISGFRVIESVKGYGKQRGHTELYRGAEYVIDALPKTDLVVVVDDDMVKSVVEAIIKAARTGRIGDGKVEVSPVEQFWSIGSGEDEAAKK